MPWLNGLEAARQIIHVSPNSRIIFLTEHNSLQMVRHALEIGARGYLIKSTAGIELLRALEAVFLGDVYIGRGVALPDLPGSD
jgi:DNA-binding NarL/FixJ family response regulator